MHAVIAVRLSRTTDATTSPARQLKSGRTEAERRGAEVVGIAEDLDVSASKVDPFSRPELGHWLARPADFDAVIWWRLDRAVRSMADMSALVQGARRYEKALEGR